ncbi:hypothetical protein BN59_00051 [Legionella massiliensis]|uniref:Uncharacterized protein n=1 Tax=Legionella massiliensis TaxID=1034943 RepID=A0A078KVQ1_9GAMM|nr:hypothetical protein BN59_00051 [Legionella massiliensis]CEE11531.1 hypothetical protein BN1094_00051 [Legionella massiliensis]
MVGTEGFEPSTTSTPFLKRPFSNDIIQYQKVSLSYCILLIFIICYTSKNIKRFHVRSHESTPRSTPNF